jgi:hypothetical protein
LQQHLSARLLLVDTTAEDTAVYTAAAYTVADVGTAAAATAAGLYHTAGLYDTAAVLQQNCRVTRSQKSPEYQQQYQLQ